MLLLILLINTISARETDQFTINHNNIKCIDSSELINQQINDMLLRCQVKDVYRCLYNRGKNIEYLIDKTPNSVTIKYQDSIYGVFSLSLHGIVKMFTKNFDLASSFCIRGIWIGTDKIGHYFEQGYDYYRFHDRKKALRFGVNTENTYLGLAVSGVYSNVICNGTNPNLCHYTLVNDKHILTRKFDINQDFDQQMDESINLSYVVRATNDLFPKK